MTEQPARNPNKAIQIRISPILRDRLEELRRARRPYVPGLATVVKELLAQALDDPPKK